VTPLSFRRHIFVTVPDIGSRPPGENNHVTDVTVQDRRMVTMDLL